MKKYLVILFVLAMAQPLLAQNSAPSEDWVDRVKEVVLASSGWEATNAVVPEGISAEMLNDEMWEDVLFGYPSHVKLVSLEGDFILLDGANEYRLIDTTLSVWVTDLSVPFYIPPSLGVDVDDPKFLVPLYEGSTNRIVKLYTPSRQMSDVLAEAKKGFSETGDDAAKVANIEWVEEGKSFFHEDRFYQKNGDKWETEDPDAPKAIKAGDRKNDPTFIFNKSAEGVWEPTASNKRNGYKFGMGDYAGYNQNYYRHARNGAPLGSAGAYGYPMMSQGFYPQQMWGGGFGNSWGGGWNIGWGFNVGFGGGFGNGFGCLPATCMASNYNISALVWNPFTRQLMPTSTQGGFYNDPYYGCDGGWKSSDVAVNQAVSEEVFSSNSRSGQENKMVPQGESFVDIAEDSDLRSSVNTSTLDARNGDKVDVVAEEPRRNVIVLPVSTHGNVQKGEGSSAGTTSKGEDVVAITSPTHGTAGNRNEGFGGDNLEKPNGVSGRLAQSGYGVNKPNVPVTLPSVPPQNRGGVGTVSSSSGRLERGVDVTSTNPGPGRQDAQGTGFDRRAAQLEAQMRAIRVEQSQSRSEHFEQPQRRSDRVQQPQRLDRRVTTYGNNGQDRRGSVQGSNPSPDTPPTTQPSRSETRVNPSRTRSRSEAGSSRGASPSGRTKGSRR